MTDSGFRNFLIKANKNRDFIEFKFEGNSVTEPMKNRLNHWFDFVKVLKK